MHFHFATTTPKKFHQVSFIKTRVGIKRKQNCTSRTPNRTRPVSQFFEDRFIYLVGVFEKKVSSNKKHTGSRQQQQINTVGYYFKEGDERKQTPNVLKQTHVYHTHNHLAQLNGSLVRCCWSRSSRVYIGLSFIQLFQIALRYQRTENGSTS